MQAGTEKKLMRLTYDGATRVVEPYSLAHKKRQDGVAQEYLYVFDRVGGHSGPGIKALFHYKIHNLELMEESFEPRFEVELAKAGDSTSAGSFSAQARAARPARPRARSRRPRTRTGLVYVIQCSYCTKQFRRTTHSTRLNKHQDCYGNECYGRVGFLVRYG